MNIIFKEVYLVNNILFVSSVYRPGCEKHVIWGSRYMAADDAMTEPMLSINS